MADPADSADFTAPRRSRGARSASSKRRVSSASSSASSAVSVETEDKLARAVQSAQRLAQLSDMPRDDSTLDLFPEDPTRALVESMTIDLRQGTLSGFELPEVVRVAVEAAQAGNAVSAPAVPRRAARSKGVMVDGAATAGVEARGVRKRAEASVAGNVARVEELGGVAVQACADAIADAGARVEESVAPGADVGVRADESATPAVDGIADAPTPSAVTDADMPAAVSTPDVNGERLSTSHDAKSAFSAPATDDPTSDRHAAPSVIPVHRAGVAAPELDRARATAFADTVDALYGVIADQRRAAADLTRRMKWMLAIVAGALLVTVGVGITQTLLLSRLARDAAAQQQRTEQMLQTQQAALAGVLERVAASAPASASAPGGVAAQPAAGRPAAPAASPRHLPHGHRVHSPTR